jgi:hypothetical protein
MVCFIRGVENILKSFILLINPVNHLELKLNVVS